MAQAPYDPDILEHVIRLVAEHGSVSAAARASDIPVGTLQNRYKRAVTWKAAQKPFTSPDLPSDLPDAKELLERRRREFSRVDTAKQARKLIPVTVQIDGPFGIAHFGDPHVDDPGCDIGKLEQHLKIVNKTTGLFAGNVGDYTNNWIGRLARLHANQETTARESWVLAEWLFQAADWIYLVGGNHDAWSGDADGRRGGSPRREQLPDRATRYGLFHRPHQPRDCPLTEVRGRRPLRRSPCGGAREHGDVDLAGREPTLTVYAILFGRGLVQVTLVALNVTQVAAGRYVGAFLCGGAISLVWWWNSSAKREDVKGAGAVYAFGAAVGTMLGMWLGSS